MGADVAAANTVYYVSHVGRLMPLWDGERFVMHDFGDQLSQATTDATKSPGSCASNANYDVFGWLDGRTYRATRGPAWASATSRGTGAGTSELEIVNGLRVNRYSITKGPSARRGTYLGTIRANGSATVDFSGGGTADGGVAGNVGLWNAYNRVPLGLMARDTVNSLNYATAVWRPYLNSSNNRHSFIRGLDEDAVSAVAGGIFAGNTGFGAVSIGLDSTSAIADDASTGYINNTGAAGAWSCAYAGSPGLGWHYLQLIEYAASGTITPTGDWGTGYAREGFGATVFY